MESLLWMGAGWLCVEMEAILHQSVLGKSGSGSLITVVNAQTATSWLQNSYELTSLSLYCSSPPPNRLNPAK